MSSRDSDSNRPVNKAISDQRDTVSNSAGLDDWGDRPATRDDGCSPEPLDGGVPDHYGLHKPITDDASIVDKDRYLGEDGKPLTHFDAVGSYIGQRHSEGTTAKRHGWTKGRRHYAKQQYRRGMGLDRQLLTEYKNTTTVLLSLRMSPPDAGRLTMLTALKTAADATINQLRYRLQDAPDAPCDADKWEYIAVFAGTEELATPHLHIYVWVDGDVSRDQFKPVVDKFVETCKFAPNDGTGNRPDDGAVRIRGNEGKVPRVDDGILNPTNCEYQGQNSWGAVYVLTQLPHLQDIDRMARDELLHSSTIDAWSGQAFRSSASQGDIRDEFLADAPVSSQTDQ